ncbi:MAG: hypothetical protein LBJ12_09690 [Oscillospiraceae bacterium]|nr:hypothetical protein [Oscillospiraceae bacterium]
MKNPKGSGKYTIHNQFKRSKKQAHNLAFDARHTTFPDEKLSHELQKRITPHSIQKIILITKSSTVVVINSKL